MNASEVVMEQLRRLKRWSILQGKENMVWVSPTFKEGLLSVWMGPMNLKESNGGLLSNSDPNNVLDVNILENRHAVLWNNLLGSMVGGDEDVGDIESKESTKPNNLITSILIDSGLLAYHSLNSDNEHIYGQPTKRYKSGITEHQRRSNVGESLKITHAGFQFLLYSKQYQIWTLLVHFMQSRLDPKQSGTVNSEYICILFRLALMSHTVPSDNTITNIKGYSLNSCTKTQREIISNFLSVIGIVHVSSAIFYPTPATRYLLFSCSEGLASDVRIFPDAHNIDIDPLTLIVESNYHIYVYTKSPLRLSMLSLFVQIQHKFPTFAAGILTRDSCKRAFKYGITSTQIISFLTDHIHPKMRQDALNHKRSNILPVTLVDQIHLWELELHRITIEEPSFMYHNFMHTPDYDRILEFAKQQPGFLLSIPDKRLFVLNLEAHEKVSAMLNKPST